MGQPYVGEIRIFAGNFAPAGWAFCDGSLIPISQNDTLFNLIGTTYGGDGQTTFALPNLQSCVPVHQGTASSGTPYVIAQTGGVETVTLTTQQMPAHSHALAASSSGQTLVPTSGTVLGVANAPTQPGATYAYGPTPATTTLKTDTLKSDGGSQPHSNIQPYVAIYYIISLYGIYPSPS